MKRAITNKSHENNFDCELHQVLLKTKNKNEMKTKNNVQKTILRSVAVLTSFVLISLTVSAQDFWKKLLTHSSFNEIALAMVENTKTSKTELPADDFNFNLLEAEAESPLELEDWMFPERDSQANTFQFTVEPENEMQLEEWMVNDDLFEPELTEESPLELEDWMTSESTWKV
jgi:hypothetical protein